MEALTAAWAVLAALVVSTVLALRFWSKDEEKRRGR